MVKVTRRRSGVHLLFVLSTLTGIVVEGRILTLRGRRLHGSSLLADPFQGTSTGGAPVGDPTDPTDFKEAALVARAGVWAARLENATKKSEQKMYQKKLKDVNAKLDALRLKHVTAKLKEQKKSVKSSLSSLRKKTG
eukprot:CAMPEP_0118935936 /NCGR_PEP_ID=MMETSP1169-20130426/15914_1 /TAXON_ID=36882 /ORGANISM="Pyramimonas obovata, Strain CCMP722" /LENGTH=136 /DNA_ID=CAMNT_0006879019 /DNA_START=194 /DNA_END=604 /DNA_ORIENTATION=-